MALPVGFYGSLQWIGWLSLLDEVALNHWNTQKCRTIRQKKKEDMIKKVDEHKKQIVGAVDVAWKHKEKIIDSGKKIAKMVVKMK